MHSQSLKLKFKALHPNFKLPKQMTGGSAGFDLYMPEAGHIPAGGKTKVMLGFAGAVPNGYVALIAPRSGVGSRITLEVANTVGFIDSDFRGEWIATLMTKTGEEFSWEAGERLLQVVVVPFASPELVLVDELDETERGEGGLGSSGK